ncbi:MAG: hypothetical protein ACTHMY_08110 [Solirubrobacteraceae bacterium]
MNSSPTSDRPTWADLFHERTALVSAPAFFGPPVIFVLGPWLLLVLLLIGPFALILTGLLILAAAAVLLAGVVAAIASPYLVVRHLHKRKASHEDRRYRRHWPDCLEARQHAPYEWR